MEAGPSTHRHVVDVETQDDASVSKVFINLPTNLLIIPPTAAMIGLVIGMSRGGSRARLRFLAENAHRQPRTVQGWYFYTKTRNYRVFFAGAKSGAKYALGLGGASAAFVLLDESAGLVREQLVGVQPLADDHAETEVGRQRRRRGWREGQVYWADGAIAGTIMGTAVGTTYRLPRPLFVRALFMGALLGGVTSALQRAQDHLRLAIDEQDTTAKALEAASSLSSPSHNREVAAPPTPILPDLHAQESHPDLLPSEQPISRAWYDVRAWFGQ